MPMVFRMAATPVLVRTMCWTLMATPCPTDVIAAREWPTAWTLTQTARPMAATIVLLQLTQIRPTLMVMLMVTPAICVLA
jgi:hypothetical protein